MKVSINIEVDPLELWISVMGSAWEQAGDHFLEANYLSGDWDEIGVLELTGENPNGEGIITKKIGINEILEAYAEAINRGHHHCNCSMVDLENYDSCAGDIILQLALYGELIFG